jgi:CHAT domain-containing protein
MASRSRSALALAVLCCCAGAHAADLPAELDRAAHWLAIGDPAQALEVLGASAPAIAASVSPRERARAWALQGRCYLQLGAFDAAEPLLTRALDVAAQASLPDLAIGAYNDLGLLHGAQRRDFEALTDFVKGIALAREVHDPAAAVRMMLNAADVDRRRGDERSVREQLDGARASLRELPPGTDSALLAAALAARSTDAGARVALGTLLDDALRAAGDDERARGEVLGQRGHMHELAGERDAALDDTRRALFAAQAARAPELIYAWEWQAGRILARAGDKPGSLAFYRRALATLAPIRHDQLLQLRSSGASYRDSIGPLFTEFADLLLRDPLSAEEPAARRGRLVEAREVIEQLKTVELEDYFRDDCVVEFQARQRSIDQLPAGSAAVYPVILPDRLELLLSIGGDIEKITVPVGAGALAAEALMFRKKVEKRTTNEFLPHAQQLYAWLIAPLLPELEAHQVDTLVLVPDGPLLGMPLSALHDGEHFLVERYALAIVPGLHMVEPRGTETSRLALLGGLSESVQGFPALPSVDSEMADVGHLYRSETLSNEQFTVPRLEHAATTSPYNVLHIASHGKFDNDPHKSFLLTYDGRIGMDALERIVKLRRVRDDPVDLLTLSACQTAVGDERAALGLAGVAIKAGARSVVATLWYINDDASSTLVRDFYHELAAGKSSKAQALRTAQRKLLGDLRFRHPGYWAPFLVIGNWS